VRVEVDVALTAEEAFDALVDELALALEARGLALEPGRDGRVLEDGTAVAEVTAWQPGECLRLDWRPAPWQPGERLEIEMTVTPGRSGTRVTIVERGLAQVLGEDGAELAGWFVHAAASPLMAASAPRGLGDWITDRGARRPSGARAREGYRDPLYHLPNFMVILELLSPAEEDVLLEVGCGGGAFLAAALARGCRAVGVDHSPDMVRLTREANAGAVAAGRLEVVLADAAVLPLGDAIFTCAVMTGVLGFLPDPVAALAELHRTLMPGGRAVLLGSDPALRGTIAAPEPFAARLRFYDDATHERLAREAGFADVRVERHDMEQHAREVGVPEEHVPSFAGPGGPFVILRKTGIRSRGFRSRKDP
jgi:SAM-dependent methyltransferase